MVTDEEKKTSSNFKSSPFQSKMTVQFGKTKSEQELNREWWSDVYYNWQGSYNFIERIEFIHLNVAWTRKECNKMMCDGDGDGNGSDCRGLNVTLLKRFYSFIQLKCRSSIDIVENYLWCSMSTQLQRCRVRAKFREHIFI